MSEHGMRILTEYVKRTMLSAIEKRCQSYAPVFRNGSSCAEVIFNTSEGS